jgi:hypothetical protein
LAAFTRLPGASSGQNPPRLSGYRWRQSYEIRAARVKGDANNLWEMNEENVARQPEDWPPAVEREKLGFPRFCSVARTISQAD